MIDDNHRALNRVLCATAVALLLGCIPRCGFASPTSELAKSHDAAPEQAPAVNDFWNEGTGFMDGDLNKLSGFFERANRVVGDSSGDSAIDSIVTRFARPENLISIFWELSGDVRFSSIGEKRSLDLRHERGSDTWIRTVVILPLKAENLEFDVDIVSPSEGDTLEVLLDQQSLGVFHLEQLPPQNRLSISLDNVPHLELQEGFPSFESMGVPDRGGKMTFQLTGPHASAIVASLRNFTITEAAE